jgi:hypothetical protein
MITSWTLPSSGARIVAALHYEFFVPSQAHRKEDVEAFFGARASDWDRLLIVRKYHVRWIVLNSALIPPQIYEQIMVRAAIVERVEIFSLLDAKIWADHVESRWRGAKAQSVSSLDRGSASRRRTDDDLAQLADEADRDSDHDRRGRLHHHVGSRALVVIPRLVEKRMAIDEGQRAGHRSLNNGCASLNGGTQRRLGRGERRFRGAGLAPRQTNCREKQKYRPTYSTHGISSFRTRSPRVGGAWAIVHSKG